MRHFPVAEIRSVDLGVADLESAERFYTTAWGLETTHRMHGSVYLRASGRDHHVLALHTRQQCAVLSVTLRVCESEELARVADRVSAAGGRVRYGPAGSDGPEGGELLVIETPEHYVLRFVHGDTLHAIGGVRRAMRFGFLM